MLSQSQDRATLYTLDVEGDPTGGATPFAATDSVTTVQILLFTPDGSPDQEFGSINVVSDGTGIFLGESSTVSAGFTGVTGVSPSAPGVGAGTFNIDGIEVEDPEDSESTIPAPIKGRVVEVVGNFPAGGSILTMDILRNDRLGGGLPFYDADADEITAAVILDVTDYTQAMFDSGNAGAVTGVGNVRIIGVFADVTE